MFDQITGTMANCIFSRSRQCQSNSALLGTIHSLSVVEDTALPNADFTRRHSQMDLKRYQLVQSVIVTLNYYCILEIFCV